MNAIKKWFRSVSDFLKEVKVEALKVSYPSKDEVIHSTTVVVFLTLIVAMLLAVMDAVLVRLLRWII